MSMSILCEERHNQLFKLKVMTELLTQAHINSVDPEALVTFLGSQVQCMLSCPPNYNKYGKKERVWVMRGFYPDTPVFFKLVVVEAGDSSYYAKASSLRVATTLTKGGGVKEDHMMVNSDQINENAVASMENALLSADNKVHPLVTRQVKVPRCMSPKGMPIYSFRNKKTSKGKKDAKESVDS